MLFVVLDSRRSSRGSYSNLVQGEFPIIDPGETAMIDAL